jgi:nitrogenase molybdenum-iron protein NifN
MAGIVKRQKALSVSPLKASQPVGGALAFMGFNRAMPMLHGSQGCTAFAKVFFVRHFREPIPLQTTAMDQVSSVMGADGNIVEGLKTICSKSRPAVVGVLTTGLSETQGTDVRRAVLEFREANPEFDDVAVVPVTTPDFTGCAETGYAAAVTAIIDVLVPSADVAGTRPGSRPRQVNVLAGSMLTPGDVETLKELIEAFGLRPLVLPDISDSLDGHLGDEEFSPVTVGGTARSELATLGDAAATLVVGESLNKAADILRERTGVPDHRFGTLMGIDAMDALVAVLAQISGQPVPERIERQRAQLQDAMVDTHFMIGQLRVAIAADPDVLYAYTTLLAGMGADVVAAVAPSRAPVLGKVPASEVKLGDLEDLELAAREKDAQLIVGNSHAAASAERLGLPLLRAGFPQYDLLGGYARTWIGYRGTRQALFDLANLAHSVERGEIAPYHSVYAQKIDDRPEGAGSSAHLAERSAYDSATPSSGGGLRH